MSMLDQIPVITEVPQSGGQAQQPAAARPSGAWNGAAQSSMGRRGFIRTAFIGGTALAMTSLGWVADRMPAFAVTRTSRHPNHCMDVNVSGDTPCWGRTSISSTHCASDHYHRLDSGGSSYFSYSYHWDAACGGYAGWYWSSSAGKWNCWDGHYNRWSPETGATSYTTLCKYKYA